MKRLIPFLIWILALLPILSLAQTKSRFKVLVLSENGGNHVKYSERAKVWLNQLAVDSNFTIDYIHNTEQINTQFLKQYRLFIQLDYPPYAWTPTAADAFEKYVMQKRGAGWVGFHHATLLGEFDGYPLWKWFSNFMGGITFKNYMPNPFVIQKEEWYTYNRSPRQNVEVIASVDESSYEPDTKIKMGDHPVIWSNPKILAKNVYIFMGHGPDLFDNEAYQLIFKNAIFWATQN